MEIRQYAERILRSAAIEDKLSDPGPITDLHRHIGEALPAYPARPDNLALDASESRRTIFPGDSRLEETRTRGEVLHFFANHELMALELMALILLRFPDAPPAFRRDLVETMRDEQRHMSMYLGRMSAFGVAFGDVGVNDFFWRNIAQVDSLEAFVARMSLTLEQANLDFALHYADVFRQVGDVKTANVLHKVFVDEIAHVRRGLRWFERWKAPELSTWQAWQQHLTMPLTPARAKGIGFAESARRQAGLSEDFIDRLRVYAQSKGRPPRVHVFNPNCESQVALDAVGHTPSEAVSQLICDLETLPMVLASRDDVLLVRRQPDRTFLSGLQALGFVLPEFVVAPLDQGRLGRQHPLRSRHIGELLPWGWSPDTVSLLSPLMRRVVGKQPWRKERFWSPARRALYSKGWAAERGEKVLAACSEHAEALCGSVDLAQVETDMTAALARIEQLWGRPCPVVVVKAPFGSSGRAMIRLRREGSDGQAEPNDRQRRWLERILESQGALVIEPWHQAELNLSMQFHLLPDGSLRIDGMTRFLTDTQGRYRGTIIASPTAGLEGEVVRFLHGQGRSPGRVEQALRQVVEALHPELKEAALVGPAGIDALVFRGQDGLRLKPLLELNPRTTMGHVGLSLSPHVAGGNCGLLLLLGQRDLQASGCASFNALMSRIEREVELVMQRGPPTSLRSGVIALTDPERASTSVAVLLVARKLSDIEAAMARVGITAGLEQLCPRADGVT